MEPCTMTESRISPSTCRPIAAMRSANPSASPTSVEDPAGRSLWATLFTV
jgi:hypothetical protein